MNDQQIEQEIQAKRLTTGPRVTPADIEACIKHIEIVKHTSVSGQVLRWAVITTANGFSVVGKHSCAASPENDNAELGEKLAEQYSRNELWPLLAFELKSKLAAEPKDYRDRVRLELADLQAKGDKLAAFIASDDMHQLPAEEQQLLGQQLVVMMDYRAVLQERIEGFAAAV